MRIEEVSLFLYPSLMDFIIDLDAGENGFGGVDYRRPDFSPEAWLHTLCNESRGIGLPQGYLPATTYWLIGNNDIIIGMGNLRHGLTDSLKFRGGHIGCYIKKTERNKGYGKYFLRKLLQCAFAHGINDVLLTTDLSNISSQKVILHNHGEFDSEDIDKNNVAFKRFWIKKQDVIPSIEIKLNGKFDDNEIEILRAIVGWDNSTGPFSKVRNGLFAHFTARSNGVLIGFIDILSDGIADAFLQDLVVHPKFQKNGIGSELMRTAIKFIQTKDIKCIQITFQDGLETFYKQFGFHFYRAGIIDRDTMDVDF